MEGRRLVGRLIVVLLLAGCSAIPASGTPDLPSTAPVATPRSSVAVSAACLAAFADEAAAPSRSDEGNVRIIEACPTLAELEAARDAVPGVLGGDLTSFVAIYCEGYPEDAAPPLCHDAFPRPS